MKPLKPCADCLAEGRDPYARKPALTPAGSQVPMGRCITHERARKKRTRQSARERRWGNTYGITAEEYDAIMAEQGGVCALCRRAKGLVKPLCVDHDHATGMVRGALCNPCNADVLGQARDDIEFFERCIAYLSAPPAVRAIGVRIVPNFEENQ